MEPNDTGLSSYYHHQPTQQHPPPATVPPPPTNGILPNSPHMVYPHSVPPPPVLETVRRKRGRPRKYGTPEQAAAAKRMSSAASPSVKKDTSLISGGGGGGSSSSIKKSQLAALGNAGQGFIPHIITVVAGQDVGQKIMSFMQQSKREICILSASGSISNVSLRQPSTFGGSITYEGRFDIISLCGSYIRTELGGRTGGLSVCLSSADGQIIGGGVGGPLTAAGPIQVIVGAFVIDTKKDIVADRKADDSVNKSSAPIAGMSVSHAGFLSTIDSSGNQFMVQPRSMQMTPSLTNDWSGTDTRSNASYDFSGRMGPVENHSPENGDYDHIQDRD